MKGTISSHRSMLVNVSRLVKIQNRISELIDEWSFETVRDIKNYCMLDEAEACRNSTIWQLKNDWNNVEYPFRNKTNVEWEEVQKNWLLRAVSPIEVRTINQKSNTKILDYALYNENGLRVIAVGGLSLSRGLTLEGLVVSYFHRNSQMYDTLMQMGRWFGYRNSYEDLFRIWMPDDDIGWYSHITDASNELREEIARMNRLGATPREFGLKVRAHPTTLIITARNKMKNSEKIERWITLDGRFFETPRFLAECDEIRANKKRTDDFIQTIIHECGEPISSGKQPLFWKDVPREHISGFIKRYSNHPLNMEADGQALANYIDRNINFVKWDVLVPSSKFEAAFDINGCPIRPFPRPLTRVSGVLSSYGSKMRIGTMGLTKHGLTDDEVKEAVESFIELKHDDYVQKYGEKADEKLDQLSIPDRAYLIKGRNPILIIHYLKPTFEKSERDKPRGFNDDELIVGYGIGFPTLAESEPVYAVYYINMVEQQQYLTDEIEEDQLDDIDGED